MSTFILDASCDTLDARYISLSGMATGRAENEDLANFVRRNRNEKRLSLRDVEINSGGTISKGYVGQIENRTVLGQAVTPQKLAALAKGLRVSEDEVFAVARGKPLEPLSPHDFYSALAVMGVEEFSAYGGVQNLTLEDQQEIIAVIEAMVEARLKRKKPPADKKKGR
jgi:transcriptional regulator with XRE-family HTH domain